MNVNDVEKRNNYCLSINHKHKYKQHTRDNMMRFFSISLSAIAYATKKAMIFQFHLAQFIDIFIIHSARLHDVSIPIRLSRLLDTPPITRLVSMKALLHFECTLERVHVMLLIYLKWTRNRIIRYNHFSFQFEYWSLLLALRSVTLDWIRYILLKFIQCIPLIWWDGFIHEIWKNDIFIRFRWITTLPQNHIQFQTNLFGSTKWTDSIQSNR